MDRVMVPVSIGELVDKITILEIKLQKLTNRDQLNNVSYELTLLKDVLQKIFFENNFVKQKIEEKCKELKKINLLLWCIEENKRLKESTKTFDKDFIELARAVYIYNDKRAEIKRLINLITNSDIIEEKSYSFNDT